MYVCIYVCKWIVSRRYIAAIVGDIQSLSPYADQQCTNIKPQCDHIAKAFMEAEEVTKALG